MTAPKFLSFVGKDATTLCKQIRRQSADAKDFLGHLKDDNGGNNFSDTAFHGDRGLDKESRDLYDVAIKKPTLTKDELIKLAQNWIDSMGGEFKGDSECGCVPAHYAIRWTTHLEHRIGPFLGKTGMKVDIPINFADDGSFTGQAVADIEGVESTPLCRGQSTGKMAVQALGKAIETPEKQSMHFQLNEASPVVITAQVACSGASLSSRGSQWGRPMAPFDMKGLVGEAIDKPIAQYPGMTLNMHLEIMQLEK